MKAGEPECHLAINKPVEFFLVAGCEVDEVFGGHGHLELDVLGEVEVGYVRPKVRVCNEKVSTMQLIQFEMVESQYYLRCTLKGHSRPLF